MRFTVAVAGTITAIRFFKAVNEGGIGHSVKLHNWKTLAQLGSGPAFTDVGCPGPNWVSVPLVQPVAVSPNTEYLAVVDNLVGRWACDALASAETGGGSLLKKLRGASESVKQLAADQTHVHRHSSCSFGALCVR